MKERVMFYFNKIISGELTERNVARLKHEYKVHKNLKEYLALAEAMDRFKYERYHAEKSK